MRTSLTAIVYLMIANANSETVKRNSGDPFNIKCVSAPVWQTVHVGESVTINCTYPRGEESLVKSFCREDGDSQCKNVISTHTSHRTQMGRFTLTDYKQKSVYTVVISNMNHKDTGTYWCAVMKSVSIHCLSRIHLHIRNRDDVTPTVKSHTGKSALIKCSYPHNNLSNTKFLCKGEDPFNCLLIHTTEDDREMAEGRFILRDNKRLKHFYVHIKNVTPADAGTYWCCFDRKCHSNGSKEIHLSVEGNQVKNKRPGLSAAWTTAVTSLHVDQSHSGVTKVLIPCLAVLIVIIIVVIVLVIYRHSRFRTQSEGNSSKVGMNTEENHGDPQYEEIQELNHEATSGGALSSVYTCVSPASDQPHYASIRFQKDSVSTDRNAHPDKTRRCVVLRTEYSTVKKPEEP